MPMEQILQIDPNRQLTFKGPYNRPSIVTIDIWNPSERRMTYKMKTTSPDRFIVKPQSGILEPYDRATIEITFQPCIRDPGNFSPKFKLMNFYIPDSTRDVVPLWANLNTAVLMETHFVVQFHMSAPKIPKLIPDIPPIVKDDKNMDIQPGTSASAKQDIISNISGQPNPTTSQDPEEQLDIKQDASNFTQLNLTESESQSRPERFVGRQRKHIRSRSLGYENGNNSHLHHYNTLTLALPPPNNSNNNNNIEEEQYYNVEEDFTVFYISRDVQQILMIAFFVACLFIFISLYLLSYVWAFFWSYF